MPDEPRTTEDVYRQLALGHVRERIDQVLTEEVILRVHHEVVRERIGMFTLKEAARWLKWKSPIALGRAMVREGIPFDTTDPKKTTVSFANLILFRDIRAARYGRGRSKKTVKLEGERVA